MKKITNYFKILIWACLIMGTKTIMAQTPCMASFTYSLNAAGNVTFSSTSTGTSLATQYNWWVVGYDPSIGGFVVSSLPSTMNSSYTFSLNGSYTVQMSMSNSAPSCSSNAIPQVIVITNTTAPCNLTANTSYVSTGPGNVNFTAIVSGTLPGTTYFWNFGDNTTSTVMSPSHTYASYGSYIATLTVNNNGIGTCTAMATQTVAICNPAPIAPTFVYSMLPGGVVSFVSTATGTMANAFYYWNSSNGSSFSGVNLTQVSITYTANGVYTTTLWINNSACNNAASAQVFTVTNVGAPCSLSANYSYTPGGAAGVVNFNNSSTGTLPGVTYSWNFGDNTTSTMASPLHTYTADGYYVVTLTADNNSSNPCISTITQTVNICSVNPMTASFVYSVSTNGVVNFSSTSTGTNANTYYNWGSDNIANWTMVTGTNLIQPTITYSANGVYTATLGIYNPLTGCSAYVSQTIAVTNTACIADAGFVLYQSGTPQVWNAVPFSPVNVSSAVWNWGDGSSINTLYASHTYSAAGMYSICLSVTVACGVSDTFCTSYNVYRSSEDQGIVQINVIDPATVGIKNNSAETISYVIIPNPNGGAFSLKIDGLSNGNTTIQIYDTVGKLIYNESNKTNNGVFSKDIDLTAAANGVYYLKINSDESSVIKKIIVNK